MLKEIGSNFWLPQGDINKAIIEDKLFNVEFEDSAFTASGRSAISLVLSELKDECNKALLPSFTCESVIEPFLRHGYQVFYYPVDEELCIDSNSFVNSIETYNPSVLLLHNYFGFNTTQKIRELLKDLRNRDIVVIEDITQTLYSSYSRLPADYYVGSFRKWDGIPDGGFALKVKGFFNQKPKEEDEYLVAAKVSAMKAKYDYLFHNVGEKNAFLKMYAKAEDILEQQKDIYKMSNVSIREQANLDVDKLKARRKANYLFLLNNLRIPGIRALFSKLPDDVIPLYFPIICKGNRATLQTWLRANQIFAPIVWPKPDYIEKVNPEVDFFYNNLLCVPCDQRYDVEEMKMIMDCLNSFSE